MLYKDDTQWKENCPRNVRVQQALSERLMTAKMSVTEVFACSLKINVKTCG